jgi:uncharacterized protein
MSTQDRWWFRIGVLTDLVARSRTKLGRTALMKLAFLLQTVEGLPLGYNFRLYTYGPFDEDVLNDLGQAECMQAVVSTMIPFSGGEGYGYEFSPGPSGGQVRILLAEAIKPYEGKLDQMIERFGNRSAADLELLSTIVYADRDCQGRTPPVSPDELARQVQEIKPRFSVEYIKQNIEELNQMGLLSAAHTHPTSSRRN